MSTFLTLLLVLAMLGVLGVLGMGVATMIRGGNPRLSNKFMQSRVILQAVALTLLALWGSGELMIIILAALLDVPQEQYEAAQLDGAGPIRRFWHVTIPAISPVLLFGVVNSIIYALQFFTQAIVAASASAGTADVAGNSKLIGAPQNSTLTYPIWLYVQGFRYFNMGYAAAMAVLLFIVSAGFTWILVRQLRKTQYQEDGA